MTYCLYIDEKGPQQTLRIQNKIKSNLDNDPKHKVRSANDFMMTYFAAGLLIDEKEKVDFEKKFNKIERDFKGRRYNKQAELKGSKILKGKTDKGFAGLTVNIVDFYNKVFSLIKEHHAKICVLSESKFENIIENILDESEFENIIENLQVSREAVIYSLTKFLADEPALTTVKLLESDSFTTKEAVDTIIKGLKNVIDNFEKAKRNPNAKGDKKRGDREIDNYKELIKILREFKYTIVRKNTKLLRKNVGQFNWEKIESQLMDFLKDNDVNSIDVKLYLDQGIDKTNFNNIQLKEIEESIDSKNCEEIRACDFITTLVGSIASKLSAETLYNPNKPLERRLIPQEWYDFSNNNKEFEDGEKHFQLITILNKNINYYHTIFSDDITIFQSFVEKLSEFSSYEELRNADKNKLNEEVFGIYLQTMRSQLEQK